MSHDCCFCGIEIAITADVADGQEIVCRTCGSFHRWEAETDAMHAGLFPLGCRHYKQVRAICNECSGMGADR